MNYTLNSTLAEGASKNNGPNGAKAKEIFLGIDAHLKSNQVARKIDNSAIGPVQNLSFEELLLFAHKQLSLAEKVYAVYEAGPLGYVLYRRLRELGLEAYVSAPEWAGASSTNWMRVSSAAGLTAIAKALGK
jgi:hypothetical protein